ncbi:MAG: proton-conducting transporter membrane subunit [Pyramidobacter sp.]|nr:proton-conducting transporter membrane subunit [Pyramidobacter sp.]
MNIFNHLPALALAVPMLGAFASPVVNFVGGRKARSCWLLGISALVTLIVFALLCRVCALGTQIYVMGADSWNLALPSGFAIPVRIVIEVDAFNAVLAFAAALSSFAGAVYGIKFVEKFTGLAYYSSLYLLLTVGTLGMILTGDLFNFFVFMEIASVASFGLIAFWRDRAESVEASFKYMLVSQMSAMLILMALAFIYGRYGVLNMAGFSRVVQTDLISKVTLIFILVALGMKCGAFPMHMWMPDSYAEAPASVTVLLVATSQASLVVLLRFCFTLYGTAMGMAVVPWALIIMGCLSMFCGVSMAVVQHEVKRLMGYHSVSQVGYMLTAFGVGLLALGDADAMKAWGMTAIEGGVFHMINYMLYKGLLFLCAGALYYAVGSRDLDKMGGLARKMPYTAGMFLVAAAAISGMPPFNGFVSKWMIYESVYAVHPILMVVALATSVLTLASFVKVYQAAFLGASRAALSSVREVPRAMLVGMAVLCAAILLLSFFPSWSVETLVRPAAEALVNRAAYQAAVLGGAL